MGTGSCKAEAMLGRVIPSRAMGISPTAPPE